jgi:hypothetical protein
MLADAEYASVARLLGFIDGDERSAPSCRWRR